MMNSTLTMNASQSEPLAFLAFPAKHVTKQVTGTTEDLFTSVRTILGGIFREMLSKRNAREFRAARDIMFPTYTQVMLGLGSLIVATVPTNVIDRLTRDALSEMEAEFKDHGLDAFGEDVAQQAMFTAFTLRKINDLTKVCAQENVKREMASVDQQNAIQFVTHVLVGRFNLDCLIASLRTNTPIYPEVLDCISEGLRSMVNAYAHVKQSYDLRHPLAEDLPIQIEFDDEERDLVASSMKDAYLEV